MEILRAFCHPGGVVDVVLKDSQDGPDILSRPSTGPSHPPTRNEKNDCSTPGPDLREGLMDLPEIEEYNPAG